MKKIVLDGKEITIRKLTAKDLEITKKHLDFLQSLLGEELQITTHKRLSLKEERDYLRGILKKQKQGKCVYLVAECDDKFVSHVGASLMEGKQNHIAVMGFAHVAGYRSIGLGSILGKMLSLMADELNPKPTIIQAGIFADNEASLGLAKKFGFKEVAMIPRQFQQGGKLVDEVIVQLYL